jgi:hypothetical protein
MPVAEATSTKPVNPRSWVSTKRPATNTITTPAAMRAVNAQPDV